MRPVTSNLVLREHRTSCTLFWSKEEDSRSFKLLEKNNTDVSCNTVFFFSNSAILKCNQLMVAEYTGWRFHQEHLCSVTQHNTEIKIEYVLIFNPKAPLKYKKHNKT